ncbi:hypothetical protein Lesp02_10760 [Lentzea sp. NBRC 105346]|nr:hypothetical protein Lesp02_10760 [Lentzea sp. NBRC 105346]
MQAGVGYAAHLPPLVGGWATGFAVVVVVAGLLLEDVALEELGAVVVVVAADEETDELSVG